MLIVFLIKIIIIIVVITIIISVWADGFKKTRQAYRLKKKIGGLF